MSAAKPPARNGFVMTTKENADMNQYWYSPATIALIVAECDREAAGRAGGDDADAAGSAADAAAAAATTPATTPATTAGSRATTVPVPGIDGNAAPAEPAIACLSTPSVYFSLSARGARTRAWVFDIDTQWAKDPHFVRFDFTEDPPAAASVDAGDSAMAALRGTFSLFVIDPPFITREVWERYALWVRYLGAPGCRVIATTTRENAPMMCELLGVKPQKFRPSVPHLVYQYDLYANYESEDLSQANPEIPPDSDDEN
jgi:hypothetical protein